MDISTTTTVKKTIMRSLTKMTTTTFDSDDVYIGPQTPLAGPQTLLASPQTPLVGLWTLRMDGG